MEFLSLDYFISIVSNKIIKLLKVRKIKKATSFISSPRLFQYRSSATRNDPKRIRQLRPTRKARFEARAKERSRCKKLQLGLGFGPSPNS